MRQLGVVLTRQVMPRRDALRSFGPASPWTRGKPSYRPRRGRGAKALVIDGLVLAGVVGSLGLVVISALLNYRFGFRLGGSDEVERQLYGFGFGLADVVKALMRS